MFARCGQWQGGLQALGCESSYLFEAACCALLQRYKKETLGQEALLKEREEAMLAERKRKFGARPLGSLFHIPFWPPSDLAMLCDWIPKHSWHYGKSVTPCYLK